MSETNTPWLRSDDFFETEYRVTVSNSTTGMPLKAGSVVELVEILENGMVLKLPKNSCASGHMLQIKIAHRQVQTLSVAHKPEKAKEIEVTAKVSEIEDAQKQTQLVSLQLVQFIVPQWSDLLQMAASKQSTVNLILQKMKG